ncbi:hypothetical protein SK128_010783, partial [Halocaridina rubra]
MKITIIAKLLFLVGHVEAIAVIENVMEHVAHVLKKDPLEVREVNMAPPSVPRLRSAPLEKNVFADKILPLLKEKSSYKQRKQEIGAFNTTNKWKKRGISIIPVQYAMDYPPMMRYGVQVSIYKQDGTVAITHGGIEMGQGINTKIAQVAAYVLRIPLDKITFKASDSMIGANSMVTGGSFGTDLCAHGVKMACTALRDRIEAVRKILKEEEGSEPAWEEVVLKCHSQNVDLTQRY